MENKWMEINSGNSNLVSKVLRIICRGVLKLFGEIVRRLSRCFSPLNSWCSGMRKIFLTSSSTSWLYIKTFSRRFLRFRWVLKNFFQRTLQSTACNLGMLYYVLLLVSRPVSNHWKFNYSEKLKGFSKWFHKNLRKKGRAGVFLLILFIKISFYTLWSKSCGGSKAIKINEFDRYWNRF